MAAISAGSAYVDVKPSFKGFQAAMGKESVTAAGKAGTAAGKQFGASASAGASGSLRKLGSALGAARDKEAAAAGRVKVAEANLTAARVKSQNVATTLSAAEKRLDAARLTGDPKKIAAAETALNTQRGRAATATAGLTRAEAGLATAQRSHTAATGRAKIAANDYTAAQNRARTSMIATEKRVGRMRGAYGRLSGGIKNLVGQYGALASIGAVVGGVKILGDSVKAASDAEQAVGGVDAVFGKHAKNVKKNADSAATSLGLTKTEYMSLSTVLASGLKNKGIKDFSKQSQGLVKRGADLASMFGGTTKEAVEALASAMRGEMDPIERYGVTLTADAVKAEAFALGLAKPTKNLKEIRAAQNSATVAQRNYNVAIRKHGKGSDEALKAESALIRAKGRLKKAMQGNKTELTAQQKATATLSLIQKQTKDSTGNFAKESGTLAGQQQRLTALFGDLKVTIGTGLLPILTKVVGAMVSFAKDFKEGEGAAGRLRTVLSFLGGVLGTVFGWINRNKAVLLPMAGAFLAVVGAVRAWTIAQAALNAVMAVSPFTWVVLGVAALAAGLVLAYKRVSWFRKGVQFAWGVIKVSVGAVVSWFSSTVWPVLRNVFGWIGARAMWLYNNAIRPAFSFIKTVVGGVVNWFRGTVWPVLSAVFGWIGRRVGWLYKSMFKVYFTAIKAVIRVVVWWFRDIVWPIFSRVFKGIAAGAKWLYNNGIRPAFNWITDKIGTVYRWFRDTVGASFSKTFGRIGSAAKWLYNNGIKPAFTWITDKIGKVYRWFRDTVATSFSKTLDGISKAFGGAKDAIKTVWDKIEGIVAKPINIVIGFVADKLVGGLAKLKIPGMGSLQKSINGMKIKGHAQGGWTGPGSRLTPAGIVHADEFVVKKSSRRTIERAQPGLLDAMNRHGAKALGYSTGGRVGSYFGQTGGYANGGRVSGGGKTWPLIWDYVRKHFPGVTMTSNYRPGSMSLRKSSHALGTAIDIGGSRSAISKVMTHMAKKFGRNMRDLIYSPLWGHKMISDGKWIPTPSFLYRTHLDHGHIGLLPGRNLNGGPASGVSGDGGFFDLSGFMSPFKNAVDGLLGKLDSPLAKAPVEFVKSKIGALGSWVTDKAQALLNFVTPSGVSGGIKNAIPEAQRYLLIKQALATVGLDPNNSAYQKATYNRAMKESGWDAGITQKVRDINSRRGDPAVGLMQIIGSTFRAYRDPRLPNDRRNPLSSLVAAMRYAMAKYGSITAGFNRPGGYADGGLVKPLLFDKGGMLPTGVSVVENRTGRPEPLLRMNDRDGAAVMNQRPIEFHIHSVDTDNAHEVVRVMRTELTRNGRFVGV